MRILLTAVLILTGIVRAWAGPLDTAQIPAGAAWLVHVDVDAVKTSAIAGALTKLDLNVSVSESDLEQLNKIIGMDPRKDLHGVTLFGRGYTPADGVVIVRAEADQPRLMALLRTQPGFRSESYADHELLTWIDNRGEKAEQTNTGCFHGPSLIVFGHDGELVRKTIDVLDGRSPGLADTAPVLAWKVPQGALVEARATGLAGASQFKSPVVLQAKSLGFALGERDAEVFAMARLVTESPDVAQQVQAVVGGVLALAQLQYGADPDAMKILRAVKISLDTETVEADFRGSIEDLGAILKKLLAEQVEAE